MAKMTRKQNVARIADKCNIALLRSGKVKILVEYADMGGKGNNKIRRATYEVKDHAFGQRTVNFTHSPDTDTPHIVQDGMRLAAQRQADSLRMTLPAFIGVDIARGPSISAMFFGIPKHMIPESSKTSVPEVEARTKSAEQRVREIIDLMATKNKVYGHFMPVEQTATIDMSTKSMISKLNEMTFGQLAEEYRKAHAAKPKAVRDLATLIYEDISTAEKRRRCDMVMDLADDIASAKFGIGFAIAQA